MLLIVALLACTTELAKVEPKPSWPRVGDGAWVEVRATVDEYGRAGGWAATASVENPTVARNAGACGADASKTAKVEPWLAAVHLQAPAPAELSPDASGALATAGPLRPEQAEWDVGDVELIRKDGSEVLLASALRFGEAAEVVAIVADADGNVDVQFADDRETTVEIRTAEVGGQSAWCAGKDRVIHLPWWAIHQEKGVVLVRAIRESIAVVPNEGVFHVRGVIEQVLDLAPGRVSERNVAQPRPSRPTWEPRRVLRLRANFG